MSVPDLVLGLQQENTRLAYPVNTATNLIVQILGEINQGLGKVKTTVLVGTKFSLIEFSGLHCFNLSGDFQQLSLQIEQL